MIDQQTLRHALESVADIGGQGNIVSNKRVHSIDVKDGVVRLQLALPTASNDEKHRIEDACFGALNDLPGVKDVSVMTKSPQREQPRPPGPPQTQNPFDQQSPIEGVGHIIAVASGKGGVGKSTVAVNLALALAKRGAKIGLLDADVYGPSLQILLGVEDRPTAGKTKEVRPVEKHGIKLMSLGFLTNDDTPVIWRGPIVMGVVKKFLKDVEWGELDYLVIDLPPGTGDAQLTLAQTVPITAAIIVTTPSELSIVDAQKGLRMFEQVHVPVMGVIENMSQFVCPHCGEATPIFDTGGAERMRERTGADVLGEIPLDPAVRAGGDQGAPILVSDPTSNVSKTFLNIADKITASFPLSVK